MDPALSIPLPTPAQRIDEGLSQVSQTGVSMLRRASIVGFNLATQTVVTGAIRVHTRTHRQCTVWRMLTECGKYMLLFITVRPPTTEAPYCSTS